MNDSEGFEPEEPEEELPQEPITERVRIYGAEPAGASFAGNSLSDTSSPAASAGGEARGGFSEEGGHPRGDIEAHTADDATAGSTGAQFPGEPSGGVPVLPHWTDPPTGQVPAIVDRRANDAELDPLTPPGGGPSWREHDHEWDDEGFDPSLLADDDTRVGALGDSPLSERQPWEFDDLTPSGRVSSQRRPPKVPPESETWWDDDADSEATVSGWRLADEEDVAAHAFSSRGEVTESLSTRMARPSTGEPVVGGAEQDATFVASISSSPLRRRPAGPDPVAPRRGSARHQARSSDHGGRHTGNGTPRNIPLAIATGVGVAVVGLACFAAGPLPTVVLATIVVTLAAAECYAALRRAGRRPATLLGLVATIGVMVSVYAKGVSALALVLALLVITSMLWYLVGAERGPAVEGIATTVLAFAWIGVLGSFAALILAPSQYPDRHGIAFFIGAVIATVSADVGALAVGRLGGRHLLAPRVSPHKTWEGLFGGAVIAVVVSVLLTGHIHPWTPAKAAVLGLVAAVLAPLGDLCESMIKRELGLKDMGNLLPGHGGVLDRFDALLFVMPATYYLVRVLHLG